MKKDKKEKWTACKFSNLICKKYAIKSVLDSIKGFEIVFSDYDENVKNKKPDIKILFKDGVESYRSINESFASKYWYDTGGDPNENFGIVDSCIKIKNSKYISWLMNESSPYDDEHAKDLGLIHFVFSDMEQIIDVIATYDPIIEVIKE